MKLYEIDRKEAQNLYLSEGITHIHDQTVPVEDFINALKNIRDFTVTEKVDGANLWFGLDMQGNLYTSRGGKGGGEFYDQSDWGSDFKDTGFKSAHAALKDREGEIKRSGAMKPGDVVEVEILFGDKPNAIPYWPNQIIFLRPIAGDPDIEKLADTMEGKTAFAEVENVPYTEDGETIQRHDEAHKWTFAKVQEYDVDMDEVAAELDRYIKKMEKFLYAPNIAKLELKNDAGETENPSNIEVLALRGTKPEIKAAKEKIKDVIDGPADDSGKRSSNPSSGFRFEIKEFLLNKLVRSAQSNLGPSLKDGGWIEGVVLRRSGAGKDGGDQLFKVVDQDIFTAVNQFNHQVRSFLTTKHKGPDAPEDAAGILGNLIRGMASELGHPQLGTIQASRYLKKLGTTAEEQMASITDEMNFDKVKAEWRRKITKAHKVVQSLLKQYNQQYKDKSFVDAAGRTHKYDETIHKRTLQVFAELNRDFADWIQTVNSATKPEELVMLLVGDKLK